jgi:hypothetical protein
MAKIKAAGTRKGAKRSNRSAIPCAIVVVAVIALVSLLFYALLKSST